MFKTPFSSEITQFLINEFNLNRDTEFIEWTVRGLTEWRELEADLKSIFVCQKCGANKVHYRLFGYKCPHRCEDKP